MAQWCLVEAIQFDITTDTQFNGVVVGNRAGGRERTIGHDHTRGERLWDMRGEAAFRDFIIDAIALTTPVQQSPCFVPASSLCILELHVYIKQTVVFWLNDGGFRLDRRDLNCRGLWGPGRKGPRGHSSVRSFSGSG